jgi:hypothetical protein
VSSNPAIEPPQPPAGDGDAPAADAPAADAFAADAFAADASAADAPAAGPTDQFPSHEMLKQQPVGQRYLMPCMFLPLIAIRWWSHIRTFRVCLMFVCLFMFLVFVLGLALLRCFCILFLAVEKVQQFGTQESLGENGIFGNTTTAVCLLFLQCTGSAGA